MGEPTKPKPVKLFTGLLTSTPEVLEEVEAELSARYGKIERRSPLIPFDYTDYYDEETGEGIKREFLAFEELVDPGRLPEIKLETNELEVCFSRELDIDLPRPVNIDPGYIGLSKLVLATTKNYSHRIYLRDGIFAEVTLRYRKGGFEPLPWTYPDYRSQDYIDFFEETRELYLDQLE